MAARVDPMLVRDPYLSSGHWAFEPEQKEQVIV
jgi:hypothetical protein